MKRRAVKHGVVSLSRASQLLTAAGDKIGRSALSRYVNGHADALRPKKRGKETVVNYEKLLAHRLSNVRLGENAGAPISPEAAAERAEASTGNVRAQRQLREHELAERKAKLMLRDGVAKACATAVQLMRVAVERAAAETADDLAKCTESKAGRMLPHLAAHGQRAVEAMARVFNDNGYECFAGPPKA